MADKQTSGTPTVPPTVVHLVRCTSWGGGERYARDLCEASIRAGHKVIVATRGDAEMDANFSSLPLSLAKMPLGGPFDFVSPRRLANLLLSLPEGPVVVHVHNFKDAEIAARTKRILRGKRKFLLVCTRHLVKPGKRSRRWHRILTAIDSLIFVSRLAMDEFLKTDPPVCRDRLSVIHNSVIIPEPFSTPAPLPSSGDSVRLLFTGRIAPEKGLDILIQALPLINSTARLSICGTGDSGYIEWLKRLSRELGVDSRIEWKGFVSSVFPEIRAADICVAPSTWREPFGLTIIEFMSQGRPTVTTYNGAQPEIITDGIDGILVEPSSAQALADAINPLVADRQLRSRIGRAAADTFLSRFSYPVFFEKINQIYNKASLQS